MNCLESLAEVDIYLIDLLLKKRIHPGQRVLDAGCGSGRNLRYFIEHNYNCVGFDPKEEAIKTLKEKFPHHAERLVVSSIEEFKSDPFEVIICNAVLHFARNHEHFKSQFFALTKLLAADGILFIRMASNIGIQLDGEGINGVYLLPDGSTRYLLTRKLVDELCSKHGLKLLETVKTTNVDELRSMTTLVLSNDFNR